MQQADIDNLKGAVLDGFGKMERFQAVAEYCQKEGELTEVNVASKLLISAGKDKIPDMVGEAVYDLRVFMNLEYGEAAAYVMQALDSRAVRDFLYEEDARAGLREGATRCACLKNVLEGYSESHITDTCVQLIMAGQSRAGAMLMIDECLFPGTDDFRGSINSRSFDIAGNAVKKILSGPPSPYKKAMGECLRRGCGCSDYDVAQQLLMDGHNPVKVIGIVNKYGSPKNLAQSAKLVAKAKLSPEVISHRSDGRGR